MKKAAGITGFILAALFLILGFCTNTPDKYIKSYGEGKMYEYVGGDAYNFIIEASLRGGEIAGAKTAKAIYFGVAGIIAVLSISFITSNEDEKEIQNAISSVRHSMETTHEKTFSYLSEQQNEIKKLQNLLTNQQAETFPQDSNDVKSESEVVLS